MKTALDAGQLDRQIQLLTKTTTKSAVGQPIDSWTASPMIAAQRLNLRTADITRAAGRQAVAEGRYLIRWRTGVTSDMRVRVDDADYAITAIDEPDRRQTLILTLQAIQ